MEVSVKIDALPDQDSNAAVPAPAPNAILASTAAVSAPASNVESASTVSAPASNVEPVPASNVEPASTVAVPASNVELKASASSGAFQINSATIKGKEVEEAQSSPECPICFANLNEGDQSEALPCAHVFHQHCLTKWLTMNSSCPVCRKVVGQKKKSDQRNQPSSSQMRYASEYDDHFYISYNDDGEEMYSCYSMEEYLTMRH
ncbi:hypothetical protein niasHS_016487 [Heterodera schachtii]|uniref:RING-type E3 ubiquitin transferase n=1 Tax=Heterodera schachtii TaxID=97005 RepID=A0ABD2HVT8_HETSC